MRLMVVGANFGIIIAAGFTWEVCERSKADSTSVLVTSMAERKGVTAVGTGPPIVAAGSLPSSKALMSELPLSRRA